MKNIRYLFNDAELTWKSKLVRCKNAKIQQQKSSVY